MPPGERRKEHRYVVDAVQIAFGQKRFPVIDIAVSGVRVACAPHEFEALKSQPCRLEFSFEDSIQVFAIEPRLIRSTNLCVAIGYTAPIADWEAFIREFDTFRVRELDDQLFD